MKLLVFVFVAFIVGVKACPDSDAAESSSEEFQSNAVGHQYGQSYGVSGGWGQQQLPQQRWGSSLSHQKSIRYQTPIVTFATPIVQKVDFTPPNVKKQHLQATPILQPTFQTAPVQYSTPLSTSAPVMRKGYGTSNLLGSFAQQQQKFAGGLGDDGGDDPLNFPSLGSSSFGASPLSSKSHHLKYATPQVTFATPIVEKVDMSAPTLSKQHLTASAIVQPTFQTAPVAFTTPLSTTAPVMRKGFGTAIDLQSQQFPQQDMMPEIEEQSQQPLAPQVPQQPQRPLAPLNRRVLPNVDPRARFPF